MKANRSVWTSLWVIDHRLLSMANQSSGLNHFNELVSFLFCLFRSSTNDFLLVHFSIWGYKNMSQPQIERLVFILACAEGDQEHIKATVRGFPLYWSMKTLIFNFSSLVIIIIDIQAGNHCLRDEVSFICFSGTQGAFCYFLGLFNSYFQHFFFFIKVYS